MLKLIGLGLSIDLLPIGNLLKLLKCNKILLDKYTSIWFSNNLDISEIFKVYGVEVIYASRKDLEGENIDSIVEEAKDKDLCIAVPGDPLIATTHSAIAIEALKKGVLVEIAPASSILNVGISMSCLQIYRFGKIATVVKPKNGIEYEYPLQIVKLNRSLDLHTMLLLEMDIEKNYFMTPKEAIEILINIQKRWGEEIITSNDIVIVLQAITSIKGKTYTITVNDILKEVIEFKEPPYTIIIPARKLHPIEKECLDNIEKLNYTSYIKYIDINKLLKNIISK
jgi:diphthine synthase